MPLHQKRCLKLVNSFIKDLVYKPRYIIADETDYENSRRYIRDRGQGQRVEYSKFFQGLLGKLQQSGFFSTYDSRTYLDRLEIEFCVEKW